MGHKKLIRFAAIKTFSNVFEYPQHMKGNWHQHFGNQNPIVLELACGRGEYTVGLSAMYPEKNFIGVDIKGNRMYIGAKKCLDENRTNAAFLRTQISMLADYFAPGEVSEIWITFPDPQLKTGRARKRLTYPRYLRIYRQIMAAGASIHLKTDSPDLFQFTTLVAEQYHLPVVESLTNVCASSQKPELTGIKTYYESLDIAQSNRIFYLHLQLPEQLADAEQDKAFDELLRQG